MERGGNPKRAGFYRRTDLVILVGEGRCHIRHVSTWNLYIAMYANPIAVHKHS